MADAVNAYQSSADRIAANREKYAKYFESGDNSDLSMDNFYSLLMAEMSNQDPMEPMSNTEFISQMASFTSLKNQADALYYSNANYAQSLVGKTVTIAQMSGSDMYTDSGIVTSMSLTNGEFQVKVNGNNYPLSNIMEVLPSSNPYSVTGNDGAYATSLIGKKVTVQAITSEGEVVDEGIVQRIEIKNNEISVIVNGLAYKITDVAKVELAGETDNTAAVDDTEETTDEVSGTTTTDTDDTPVNETEENEEPAETAPVTDEEDIPDLIPEDDEDDAESEEDLRNLFE